MAARPPAASSPVPPAGPRLPVSRDRFYRRRRRAFAGGAVTVAALTGVGAILAAPGDLAAVRVLGVALGWWAAVVAQVIVLATLVLDREDGVRPGRPRA